MLASTQSYGLRTLGVLLPCPASAGVSLLPSYSSLARDLELAALPGGSGKSGRVLGGLHLPTLPPPPPAPPSGRCSADLRDSSAGWVRDSGASVRHALCPLASWVFCLLWGSQGLTLDIHRHASYHPRSGRISLLIWPLQRMKPGIPRPKEKGERDVRGGSRRAGRPGLEDQPRQV